MKKSKISNTKKPQTNKKNPTNRQKKTKTAKKPPTNQTHSTTTVFLYVALLCLNYFFITVILSREWHLVSTAEIFSHMISGQFQVYKWKLIFYL